MLSPCAAICFGRQTDPLPTRMRFFGTDPLIYLALLAGLIFTSAIGFLTAQARLMPLLNALMLWPLLVWALRHARIDLALRLAATWAAALLLISLVAGHMLGASAQAAAPGSIEFNAAAMRWLGGDAAPPATGEWLPGWMQRTGLLLAGGAATAGLLPLVAGARSLAILGLWLANLLALPHPLALLAGLPPWILAEIVAQLILGVLVAEPIVTGDARGLLAPPRRRLLILGLVAFTLAPLLRLLLPHLFLSPLRYFVRL